MLSGPRLSEVFNAANHLKLQQGYQQRDGKADRTSPGPELTVLNAQLGQGLGTGSHDELFWRHTTGIESLRVIRAAQNRSQKTSTAARPL